MDFLCVGWVDNFNLLFCIIRAHVFEERIIEKENA